MARLTQSIASLAGVHRFAFVTQLDRGAKGCGLSESIVRVLADSVLVGAGVPVARGGEDVSDVTTALVAAVGIDREDTGKRLCVAELEFWQTVSLPCFPDRMPFPAITWSVARYAVVPGRQAGDTSERLLADLFGIFLADWREANPI